MRNIQTFFKVHYFAFLLSILWICYIFSKNEIPPDIGDGLMHFFYAQASWFQPQYFLDHWNKPVFTLLSSTFAQFGFNGMAVFNLMVHTLTVAVGFRILRQLGVSTWLQMLFPLVVLVPFDVSSTILGGLTEPLFNLATVSAFYLLIQKKYVAFALVVSFIPFMRSEGQFVVVLALLLILYFRAFRAIPYLLVGFVIYAIIGFFAFDDFLWYFTQNPYKMSNNIYGSGTWSHYLEHYTYFIGITGVVLFVLGLGSFFYLLVLKRWQDLKFPYVFFGAAIFLAVLIIHSYFWATGKSGSIGLTRIATQGLPLFLITNIYLISKIQFFQLRIGKIVLITFGGYTLYLLSQVQLYIKTINPFEKQGIEVASFIKSMNTEKQQIYYFMPLIAYELGVNPFIANSNVHCYTSSNLEKDLETVYKPGDFIIRDSHFGALEANLPLSEIERFEEIVKVKEFISSQQVDDRFNEVEGFVIYQYIPLEKQQKTKSVIQKTLDDISLTINSNEEYKDINPFIPKQKEDVKLSFDISSTSKELILVFDYNNTEDYSNMTLDPSKALSPTLLIRQKGTTKLYIWNPTKSSGEVSIKNIVLEQRSFHPIMH